MAAKYRVKLTTVRRRSLVVRPSAFRAHCPICGREVEMLTAAQTAEALEITDGELDALVAAGRLHAARTVSGSLRICKDSLFLS